MRSHRLGSLAVCCLLTASTAKLGFTQMPLCDQLAPSTTKAFLSLPDPTTFSQNFNKTQFGDLVQDPALKPFADGARKQIEDGLSKIDAKLGITWTDLKQVASGEMSIAVIQPDNDPKRHAVAVMADITGKGPQTAKLLAKVATEMGRRNAKSAKLTIAEVVVTRYLIPPAKGETKATLSFHCVAKNWLLASDDEDELTGLLTRLAQPGVGSLSTVKSYLTIMPRVQMAENKSPDVTWFIDPFGYAATMRAASTKKRQTRDVMRILADQGFSAVRGIGGAINFTAAQMQVVHRTYVLADSDGNRPMLARGAQLLQFPNTDNLRPSLWVPENVGTCLLANWKINEAFAVIGGIVNALEGQPGLFEEVLDGLENERNGPRIKVKKGLIAFLGERVLMVTRPKLPINVDSEHHIYAFETINEQALKASFEPALERDPTFIKEAPIPGVKATVWRHQPKQRRRRRPQGRPNPFGPRAPAARAPESPAGAMAISNGFLMYSTNKDFLIEVLKGGGKPLVNSTNLTQVEQFLTTLGAGNDCVRYYTRLDLSQRVNYELLRQNKMPLGKSLLAKLLNEALAPEEPGVRRKQKIQGEKLPPFAKIERYLGNGGVYAQATSDGWSVAGFFLRRPPAAGGNPQVQLGP